MRNERRILNPEQQALRDDIRGLVKLSEQSLAVAKQRRTLNKRLVKLNKRKERNLKDPSKLTVIEDNIAKINAEILELSSNTKEAEEKIIAITQSLQRLSEAKQDFPPAVSTRNLVKIFRAFPNTLDKWTDNSKIIDLLIHDPSPNRWWERFYRRLIAFEDANVSKFQAIAKIQEHKFGGEFNSKIKNVTMAMSKINKYINDNEDSKPQEVGRLKKIMKWFSKIKSRHLSSERKQVLQNLMTNVKTPTTFKRKANSKAAELTYLPDFETLSKNLQINQGSIAAINSLDFLLEQSRGDFKRVRRGDRIVDELRLEEIGALNDQVSTSKNKLQQLVAEKERTQVALLQYVEQTLPKIEAALAKDEEDSPHKKLHQHHFFSSKGKNQDTTAVSLLRELKTALVEFQELIKAEQKKENIQQDTKEQGEPIMKLDM